jgi:hypothetical protein
MLSAGVAMLIVAFAFEVAVPFQPYVLSEATLIPPKFHRAHLAGFTSRAALILRAESPTP